MPITPGEYAVGRLGGLDGGRELDGRVVTVVAGAVEGGREFRRLAAGLLNGNMWQPYWNSGMASGIAWLTPGEIGEIAGVALLRRLP